MGLQVTKARHQSNLQGSASTGSWSEAVDPLRRQNYAQLACDSAASGTDWSSLHNTLSAVPKRPWTTYDDLVEIAGFDSQPLGQHIALCLDCPSS